MFYLPIIIIWFLKKNYSITMIKSPVFKKGEPVNIVIQSLLLIFGLFALWFSSNKAILYASKIAQLFGLSRLFIGFALLALSTGLPELFVGIQALIAGYPLLSVGDILGSNFVDVALAMGIPALFIRPIYISVIDQKKQLAMLLISSLVMAYIFINGHITKTMGVFLLLIYAFSIIWLWKTQEAPFEVKESEKFLDSANRTLKNGAMFKLLLYLLLVTISSKICVQAALALATVLPIPIDIIGASVFAIGTSLPEIALNLQAIKRKNYSLAIGNSFGSIFNQGAFVLGLLSILSPTSLPLTHLYPIAPFMFLSYALVGYHIIRRKKIKPIAGAMLISFYVMFIIYEIYIYGFGY